MLKEGDEPWFLKIRLFSKSKVGENCIELWPKVIVIKKDIFYIFIFLIFFHDEMKIFLFKMYLRKLHER